MIYPNNSLVFSRLEVLLLFPQVSLYNSHIWMGLCNKILLAYTVVENLDCPNYQSMLFAIWFTQFPLVNQLFPYK